MIIDLKSQSFKYLKPWDPSSKHLPPIQVVTCFLQHEDKFLVLQRARKDAQYKLWGIPGGKLIEGELPITGLIREIQEETQIEYILTPQLLGTALSRTPSDGEYGLYVFHAYLSHLPSVSIRLEEHSAFNWVTLTEFQKLNLLTAQGEAFKLVKEKLENLQRGPSYV